MQIGNNFVPPVVSPTLSYRLGTYLLCFGLIKVIGKSYV